MNKKYGVNHKIKKKTDHPGFANIAAEIHHREHIPEARARAMLASHTRHASAKGKKKNPRLRRVH